MGSLSSSNRYQRAEAAIKIADNEAAGALPELRELANDSDDMVALTAMYACWKLGEDTISIDRFIKALNSGDEELVQQAVHTICTIGEPMVPKLAPLLQGSQATALLALRLLDDINGPEAMRTVRSMQNPDPAVAMLAREILEEYDDDSG